MEIFVEWLRAQTYVSSLVYIIKEICKTNIISFNRKISWRRDSRSIGFPYTFDDVGQYAKEKSGCSSASKAYKYMAEPGYLHDIKGNINWLNYFLLH